MIKVQTKRIVADCEIIEQTEVGPHVFRSVLVEPTIARAAKPGQFVNVRVCGCYDPLLRRPFSVHAVDPERGTFSLLYDVIGRGTKLLMDMRVGDKVNVVGLLGNSFDVGEDPNAYHFLVAGGCGAAPIHFLSDWICRKHGCGNATVLVGAKTGEAVLNEREFRAHGVKVEVATDDGSYGFKGFVTDLLRECLTNYIRQSDTRHPTPGLRVYSCGPTLMLREVARVCDEKGITSCQLSLERAMACGLGVCMGCVTKTREEGRGNREHEECGMRNAECGEGEQRIGWQYSRTCTDGPVFEAKELVWE